METKDIIKAIEVLNETINVNTTEKGYAIWRPSEVEVKILSQANLKIQELIKNL